MDIQAIGNQSFSVYINKDELMTRHLRPDSVTCEQILELLSPAFGPRGLDSSCLSLFPSRSELLIFIHRMSRTTCCFRFDSFECLLSAALASYDDIPSSLFYYGGSYILYVRSWDDGCLNVLSEFGERLDTSPNYLMHLREHGKTIMDGYALSELRRVFSRPEKTGK